jgi:hypothetical protein
MTYGRERQTRRSDFEAGGVTPLATPIAREVAELVRRMEWALSIRAVDHRLESAQRHLRDEIANAPRYLYGSPAWRRYRQWALARFDRVHGYLQRMEAA